MLRVEWVLSGCLLASTRRELTSDISGSRVGAQLARYDKTKLPCCDPDSYQPFFAGRSEQAARGLPATDPTCSPPVFDTVKSQNSRLVSVRGCGGHVLRADGNPTWLLLSLPCISGQAIWHDRLEHRRITFQPVKRPSISAGRPSRMCKTSQIDQRLRVLLGKQLLHEHAQSGTVAPCLLGCSPCQQARCSRVQPATHLQYAAELELDLIRHSPIMINTPPTLATCDPVIRQLSGQRWWSGNAPGHGQVVPGG